MGMERREFIRAAGLVGAGTAASVAVVAKHRKDQAGDDPTGPSTVRANDPLKSVPSAGTEDVLLRMQRDLTRAMAKPVEQRHWVMVIDQRKCVGCHACTIGCVAENHLPPGVVYRPVVTTERGEFPNVNLQFTPRPCMQCDKPPCVPVCPVKATWIRPDGVVAIDYDKCIGCRYCLTACPYGGRTSDFGLNYSQPVGSASGAVADADPCAPYEQKPNFEYAKSWERKDHASPVGNARKCHFCLHRLEVGSLPTCVSTCIGRATYFGDSNDSESLVAELMSKHSVQTLLPHKGTHPNVYYIA